MIYNFFGDIVATALIAPRHDFVILDLILKGGE